MKRRLLAIPVALMVASACVAQQPSGGTTSGAGVPPLKPQNTEARVLAESISALAAVRLFTDDDTSRAEAALRDAIAIDPTYGEPRYNLAVLAERRGDWASASKWYEEFLKIDSNSATAKKAQTGLERTNRLLSLGSSPSGHLQVEYEFRLARARGYLKADRLEAALIEVEAAEEQQPLRFEAPAIKAAVFAAKGKFDQACYSIDRALLLAPADKREGLRAVQADLRRLSAGISGPDGQRPAH